MESKAPLGYIELDNGAKAVYVMNDLFLNYTFESEEHWEEFRLMVNMLIEPYFQKHPTTIVTLINGRLHLETQYKFYINTQNTTRNQDFRATEIDAEQFKYVEFQNRAQTKPPIEERALEYFVLGVGKSKGKIANQIWVLASDVEPVLQGETFMNYILKDESTNKIYPGTSGMMFISLTKLSKEKTPAGELALFLLGKLKNPVNEDVKRIADMFKKSFEAFKDDKEVKNTMSIAEKYRNEGWIDGMDAGIAKGREEGREEGREKGREEGVSIGALGIIELIKGGLSPDEALRKFNENREAMTAPSVKSTA